MKDARSSEGAARGTGAREQKPVALRVIQSAALAAIGLLMLPVLGYLGHLLDPLGWAGLPVLVLIIAGIIWLLLHLTPWRRGR